MALFKIFKGNQTDNLLKPKINNVNNPTYRTPVDGYAYYDTSSKLLYIDADYSANGNGTITREPINAYSAMVDSVGSVIKDTYATKLSISGTTLKLQNTAGTDLSSVTLPSGYVSTTGAKGDILYWSASNTPTHLTNASSTTKKFLSITSQVPSWVTLAKSDVGLGNVENKSSATIRGELTSSNVTTALGFTPYNATNPSGYTTNTGTVTSITLKAGTGISLDTDNTAITTSGTRTITNSGVRATTINGNYLRVNTNGTNADLTIPYAKISSHASAAHFSTQAGSPSGVLKVKIKAKVGWMLTFTLRVYQGYSYQDFIISGYNYGTNYWYDPKVIIGGGNLTSKQTVTFGYDSDAVNNYCTLWVSIPIAQYTGADIFNVTNGYIQISDLSTAFEIIHETTSTGTVQTTVDAYRPWYRNEKVSSASSADSATTATKATQDGSGNNIVNTYLTKATGVTNVAWDSTNKKLTKTINGNITDVVTASTLKTDLGLSSAMLFMGSLGTGGTITSLPTAASGNQGYTYKVITAGTYASKAAKVGDVFVSTGSAWELIPSGDEPSGTVTNVATGGGLTGGPITSSGTISHADTSSQASVTASSRRYITAVTLDDYGHVTGLSTGTETVTNTDTKQNIILATTSKAYLTGVTTQPTSTAQALTGVADTGVYLTATAGEISAVQHSFNVSGTEKAYMVFNSTTNAIDFIFN